MSRFASAAPPIKAALVAAVVMGALTLWAAMTVAIALFGLHRWTTHIDVTRVPAWLWWFRADQEVGRWLKVGALGSALLLAVIAFGVAVNQRRPLHGAARWAREDELRREGLRAPSDFCAA